MKYSELKQIIKEEIQKVLKENSIKKDINYDEEYQKIRQEIMDDWGLVDDDMDDEENENDVNREADEIFYEKFGINFSDL